MNLSNRLSKAMQVKGISQADLARQTGLSTAVVSQIISGKTKNPQIMTLTKICAELDLSLDDVVREEEKE